MNTVHTQKNGRKIKKKTFSLIFSYNNNILLTFTSDSKLVYVVEVMIYIIKNYIDHNAVIFYTEM